MPTATRKAPAWIAACSRIQQVKNCNRKEAKALYDQLLATGQTVEQWCNQIEAAGTAIMDGDAKQIGRPASQLRIAEACENFLLTCGGNIEIANMALSNWDAMEKLRTKPASS